MMTTRPPPTTILNHNSSFNFKEQAHLNNHYSSTMPSLSQLTISPFLFLLILVTEPWFSMAANSRLLEGFRFVLVLVFYVVVLFLRPKMLVAADDQVVGSVNNTGFGGYAASNSVGNDERSELCNTDMSSFLPPPYKNISNMVCKPVWNNFLLRYHQGEDNLMTFIVSAIYTTGWVAMGFSKDGMMTGSTAMVGWFNKKGHARIKQYYLQGTRSSQVIENAGELPLTKVPPAVVLHGAMIYVAFQAKFDKPLAPQPLLLAFGTRYPNHYRLSEHDDKTAILFDFSAGSASAVHGNPGQMKKNHGVLGTLAWGLFLPIGAIVPRYFKHKDPLWYYLHACIQFLGFLIGLATVVLGQQLYDKIHARVPAHRGIGIFVLVLSILQILAFFLRPKKEAKFREYWNWYHHWFGRIALFFGALNIVLGIQIGSAGTAWKIVFGFMMTLILLTVVALETLSWLKRSEKPNPPPSFPMNPIL